MRNSFNFFFFFLCLCCRDLYTLNTVRRYDDKTISTKRKQDVGSLNRGFFRPRGVSSSMFVVATNKFESETLKNMDTLLWMDHLYCNSKAQNDFMNIFISPTPSRFHKEIFVVCVLNVTAALFLQRSRISFISPIAYGGWDKKKAIKLFWDQRFPPTWNMYPAVSASRRFRYRGGASKHQSKKKEEV